MFSKGFQHRRLCSLSARLRAQRSPRRLQPRVGLLRRHQCTDDPADETDALFAAIQAALDKNNITGANISKVDEGSFFLGDDIGTLTIGLLRGVGVVMECCSSTACRRLWCEMARTGIVWTRTLQSHHRQGFA